jgi:hypothetical protein
VQTVPLEVENAEIRALIEFLNFNNKSVVEDGCPGGFRVVEIFAAPV